MAYFKATIELLIWTDSEAEACDVVSETLRPHLQAFDLESALIDWKYAEMGDPAPDSGDGFEYQALEAGRSSKDMHWDVVLTNEGGEKVEYRIILPATDDQMEACRLAIQEAWKQYRELDYTDHEDPPYWTYPITFLHD